MPSASVIECIGSIDQGTSSTRFLLFNSSGSLVDSEQVELKQYYCSSEPGWCEHDPMQILQSVYHCINAVLDRQKDQIKVLAIGITNQRETTVLWDAETGLPLYNAIVWHDTRTINIVDKLVYKYNNNINHFREQTGLPLSHYFSAVKLIWLLENIPDFAEKHNINQVKFGTIDSWLLFNLTNGKQHITDISNASRTLLMNLHTKTWDKTILRELNIPEVILPKITSNAQIYDKVQQWTARNTNINSSDTAALQHAETIRSSLSSRIIGVPISGCLGDQQSSLLGQLCITPGSIKNTYGTGCFMLCNTGTAIIPSQQGLLTTVAFQLGENQPTYYALEGAVATAGSAVRWTRDSLGLIKDYSELGALNIDFSTKNGPSQAALRAIYGNRGCYFVPAFSGLLSPYWNNTARGTIVGLSHSSDKETILRATLQSIAYQTADVLEAMKLDIQMANKGRKGNNKGSESNADSNIQFSSFHVDGGLAKSEFLMQFQSDLLNISVVKPHQLECTAQGAAFAAGLAIKFWRDVEHLKASVVGSSSNRTIYQPKIEEKSRKELYYDWKRAVGRSLNWVESAAGTESAKSTSSGFTCCVARYGKPIKFSVAALLFGFGFYSLFNKNQQRK
jgi:glycerol kinase